MNNYRVCSENGIASCKDSHDKKGLAPLPYSSLVKIDGYWQQQSNGQYNLERCKTIIKILHILRRSKVKTRKSADSQQEDKINSEKLIGISHKLELVFFSTAESYEEYTDSSTLKRSIEEIVSKINKRKVDNNSLAINKQKMDAVAKTTGLVVDKSEDNELLFSEQKSENSSKETIRIINNNTGSNIAKMVKKKQRIQAEKLQNHGRKLVRTGGKDDGKARACYKEALEIYYSIYGKDAVNDFVARVLYDIGIVEQRIGRYQIAHGYCTKALSIYHRLYGNPSNKDTARVLRLLGIIEAHLGNHDEALVYKSKALDMMEALQPSGVMCAV